MSEPDYDAAKKKAEAEKAQAEADKAKADADKAKAEAAKADAEARTAAAKAKQDERTAADDESEGERAKREAERAKAIAEADKAAAAARRDEVAALIPDLKDVERGTLEVTGDQALFSTTLTFDALNRAAAYVGTELAPWLTATAPWKVLVTSDTALVDSDAVHVDVTTGLERLEAQANAVLAATALPTAARDQRDVPRATVAGQEAPKVEARSIGPEAVVGAIAQAIPATLSLFSAQRSLTTKPTTISDLAAAAAVAGAVANRDTSERLLVHDDVRPLVKGALANGLNSLNTRRQSAVARKIELEDAKARTARLAHNLRADIADLEKQLKGATGDDATSLTDELKTARRRFRARRERLADVMSRLALVDALITAIDEFLKAIHTAPAQGQRSPLTVAAIRERLHTGGDDGPWFSHVLLVKAANGTTHQLVDDRPFFIKDRISIIATASITYMLLMTRDGQVLAAGNASGDAQISGKLGSELTFNPAPQRPAGAPVPPDPRG